MVSLKLQVMVCLRPSFSLKGRSDLAWGGVCYSYIFCSSEISFVLTVLSAEGFFYGSYFWFVLFGGKVLVDFSFKLISNFGDVKRIVCVFLCK